jgi:hypothetical protein
MLDVRRVVVPPHVVDETNAALRAAGKDGYELFTLWTGRVEGDRFSVQNVHVPKQKSYRTKQGLSVRVEGDELHRLNVWLFEHQQIVGVQLHSHPVDAFHSETDDSFPIATVLGAFSVVVPDFARLGVLHHGTKVFRLSTSGWVRATAAISELIQAS